MTDLLIRLFVKNRDDVSSQNVREAYVTTASVTGIILNIFLFVCKLIFGILANSVSMIADAFNNITDAGSSVVSYIGFKLSVKHVDKKHPFGHGRMEYVAGFIVDMLIVLVGFELFKSSVEKIVNPSMPRADLFTVVVLTVAICIKLWLFFFYRKIGKRISSSGLRSTSIDSISDCAATALVLVSVIVSKHTGVIIDGYVGILVSVMILIAGVRSAKETIDLLLGMPPTKEYIEEITRFLDAYPEIVGVHDIMVHNYGENYYFVTAHAEISDVGDRLSAHDILENAEVAVGKALSVDLLLHGDPYDKTSPEVVQWRSRVENLVSALACGLKVYDFKLEKSVDGKVENISFHLLQPHSCTMTSDEIEDFLQTQLSKYDSNIALAIRFVRSFV